MGGKEEGQERSGSPDHYGSTFCCRQQVTRVQSPPKTATPSERVQLERQVHSPLKIPACGIFPPANGRQAQAPPTGSPILAQANVFNVLSDLDEERPIGSLRQGGTTSRAPSPSSAMGGLQHPTEP